MTAHRSDTLLTGEDIETYRRDGVVCLRGVADAAQVEALRRAGEAILTAPDTAIHDSNPKRENGRFVWTRINWSFNETFKTFETTGRLPEIAAELLDARKLFLIHDIFFSKEPHTPEPTPWHHDQPYGWWLGEQICQMWMPLDRATLENGTLRFVRGSHRWGKWFNARDFDPKATAKQDQYEELPDIDGNLDEYDVVSFDLDPGDCLVFSELTLHSAPGNTSDRRRRAVAAHYAGERATYSERPGAHRYGPDHGLEDGEPFGGPWFPQVWPPGEAAGEPLPEARA